MTEGIEDDREGRVIRTVPSDTYANRLILARAHAGHLSQRAAAERCGLNDANWANWERGMASRTLLEDAEAIAEGLDVDRDWLLFGGPLAKAPKSRGGRTRMAYSPMGHMGELSPPNRRVRRPRRIDGRRRTAA